MPSNVADWAQLLGAVFTAVAALAAWRAVVATRHATAAALQDARVARTFDYLRLVEERSLATWQLGPGAHEEFLEAARPGGASTPRAEALIGFLNVLEVFSSAALHGALERKVADDVMHTIGRDMPALVESIDAFRRVNGDANAYKATKRYAAQLHRAQVRPTGQSGAIPASSPGSTQAGGEGDPV